MIGKAKILSWTFFIHCAVCYSQTPPSLQLVWDPSPTTVVGYFLHTVDTGNSQTAKIDVGNKTSATLTSLSAGHKYSIYVTAYDSSKMESKPSNTISVTAPNAGGSSGSGSISIDASGQLWIKGSSNTIYGIEASSDFTNWQEIGQVNGALNPVPFTDAFGTAGTTRFYRFGAK